MDVEGSVMIDGNENLGIMKVRTKTKCDECDRVFDLLDEDDASEWYYGHDCEAS